MVECTLKQLAAGPTSGGGLSPSQVAVLARERPADYRRAIYALSKTMLQHQFKNPQADTIARYAELVAPLRGVVDDPVSLYFFGTIDAYTAAIDAGLMTLDGQSATAARHIVGALETRLPSVGTVEGLAWRVLLGQVQSVYSRDAAAGTFQQVREHSHVDLVQKFYRDTGALTYYSESEVAERCRTFPALSELQSWSSGRRARNRQAVVYSVDPYFFRTYGPMILFNAQQAPEVDFVVLVCGTEAQVGRVERDAQEYLAGLSVMNRQRAPRNLRIEGIQVPGWVGNRKTFYASARFIAVPGLLDEYEQVYAMDADMFLLRHPKHFLDQTRGVSLGVTASSGPVSVSPWRRFMAGTLVANQSALDDQMLGRAIDYLSVGLTERYSWMLDQNALSYAVEVDPEYKPLGRGRPAVIGTFMAAWEKNFQSAIN